MASTINLTVTGQTLVGEIPENAFSTSEVYIQISYDEEWKLFDGIQIVFVSDTTKITSTLDTTGLIAIPINVVNNQRIRVGLIGTLGEQTTSTNMLLIKQGTNTGISEYWYQQLLQEMKNLSNDSVAKMYQEVSNIINQTAQALAETSKSIIEQGQSDISTSVENLKKNIEDTISTNIDESLTKALEEIISKKTTSIDEMETFFTDKSRVKQIILDDTSGIAIITYEEGQS